MEDEVIIIGAGVAGLAAGNILTAQNKAIRILEARDRIGGRIHTVTGADGEIPIELGAEFVHGEENATWEFIRAARLRTEEVPDRHWQFVGGQLRQNPNFWNQLAEITERINPAAPDQDFQSFIDQAWSLKDDAKTLAREYVEGFHAADPSRISIHALAKAEAAAQREKGTRQFRIASGYSSLLQWIWDRLQKREVRFEFGAVVKEVRWEPGQVEVIAQTNSGERAWSARCLISSLPLGVLQDEAGAGFVRFEPSLNKENAINGLCTGTVCKVTFQFRERFWPMENFGFIHSIERSFPTWWSSPYGHILTGWAGGPRAETLNLESREAIFAKGILALSRVFKIDPEKIQQTLTGSHLHNWQKDPFALGAYSYTPARNIAMSKNLSLPVAQTVFFAGEATDTEGDQGTVQGAITSGGRAAREVLQALHREQWPTLQPSAKQR